jgi:hypothetical protein
MWIIHFGQSVCGSSFAGKMRSALVNSIRPWLPYPWLKETD